MIRALLLLLVGCAPAPKPQPPPGCSATTPVLYQLDFKSDEPEGYAFKTIAIHDNGAWTYGETTDGTTVRTDGGCLAPAVLSKLAATAPASWHVTKAEVVCEAISPELIEVRSGGRLIYTRRTCGFEILDPASTAAATTADAIARGLMPR